MKIVLLSVLTIMLMLTMASCGRDEAYRQGAADAVRGMQIQAEQSKQQLMQQIQPTLLTGVIFVLLVTFFGDTIVERLKERVVAALSMGPIKQAILLTLGYLFLCAVLAIWSMARCGAAWALPVLLLMAGSTAVFFRDYLPALFKTAQEPRRLALSRIKLLMFAACVILAVHELLASDGWLKLLG